MFVQPAALIVIGGVAIALAVLPRDKVLVPFLLVAVFLPLAQGFQILGLDLTFSRILLFTLYARLAFRGELDLGGLSRMDVAVIVWCGCGAAAYIALRGNADAVVNRAGYVVNYAGTYFVVRFCVRDVDSIYRLVRWMTASGVVLGLFVMAEWMSGRNSFYIFGGVPQFTEIRDGLLRCQGPFGHPLGLGLFSAGLIPVMQGAIFRGESKVYGVTAVAAATVTVAATASSAPILGLMAGCVAWAVWPLRNHTRKLVWACIAGIVCLQLAMEAPVWALIQRASIFGASSSWHRYSLIDQFIRRFSEWWLVGTLSTEAWGYYSSDVANNYVMIGVSGGVFTLVAFLYLLRCGFLAVGTSVRNSQDRRVQLLMWSLGGSLAVHVVGSIGLSYWDQGVFLFAMLLGLISAGASLLAPEARQREAPELPARIDAPWNRPRRPPFHGGHGDHGRGPARRVSNERRCMAPESSAY